MPLLASLMVSLFGSMAGFFAKWFTQKVAFAMAAVSAFGTLTTAMLAAQAAVLNGLIGAMPSYLAVPLGDAMWLLAADNLNAALDVAFAADAAIFLYRWGVGNIKIVAAA